jgi:L-fucose isomerase-like protein
VMGMLALSLASQKPSAIVDWNNNLGDDPDLGVIFHCSNLPKELLAEDPVPQIGIQSIISQTLGKDNTWGAISGRLKPSTVTFCRVSTDDLQGKIRAYIGEGELLDRKISTFGGYGAIHIPRFQSLLKMINHNGFEHHVAINPSQSVEVLHEAFSRYMGWDTIRH